MSAPRPRSSLLALAVVMTLVFAACAEEPGAPGESPAGETPAGQTPAGPETPGTDQPSPIPGGLLDQVLSRGTIVMSTDPEYPPQSALAPDGSYEGFDIDVGTEIAERLGVEIEFVTPSWEAITAGSWGGRWDMSVGSMTITTPREEVVAFTDPYYYTPAQMAVLPDSGITSIDELAGMRVCVGAATTYQEWLEGTLDFGSRSPEREAPENVTVVTLPTDRHCADSWRAGRRDFEGWLTSETVIEEAIGAGIEVERLGDPVFFEPLAVAFDRSGPDPSDMVDRVNRILEEMRQDGTLQQLSERWFGSDLTTGPEQG